MKRIKFRGSPDVIVYVAGDVKEFTGDVRTINRIGELCRNVAESSSKVCLMPNVCVDENFLTGLTMTIDWKIFPEFVGSDIGCGITVAELENFQGDFQRLDRVIREVSIGNACGKLHQAAEVFNFYDLYSFGRVNWRSAFDSAGTLDNGDDIKICLDDDGKFFLVVCSGSHQFGKEVTSYYLDMVETYLTDKLMLRYINDAKIVQSYAALNRQILIEKICLDMNWSVKNIFTCPHNFIDTSHVPFILRRGAISARKGERVIIPMNNQSGAVLGLGKGNAEWNFSALCTAQNLEDIADTVTVQKIIRPVYRFCKSAIE